MKRTHNQEEYATDGNQRFSIVPASAVSDTRLSNGAFRTLNALGVYGDKNGWCWPSLARLAAMLHKSRQAVSKDLQQLKDLGYIRIVPQFDDQDGARLVNRVQILFDRPLSTTSLPISTNQVDTPSTPEVYTPSTSEVDVNAPFNAPINVKQEAKPETPFDTMQRMIERMIGPIPMTPDDVQAINKMVESKATEADISAALAFFQKTGNVARGPAHILKAVLYQIAQRTQAANARRAPSAQPTNTPPKMTLEQRRAAVQAQLRELDEKERQNATPIP